MIPKSMFKKKASVVVSTGNSSAREMETRVPEAHWSASSLESWVWSTSRLIRVLGPSESCLKIKVAAFLRNNT